jgi:Tol biopolymer transport system component/DNA-binding winged helix-turn-helix (wHTH) protein
LSSPEPQSGERSCRQYSFSAFTLDSGRRVLRRANEEIALRPKSLDVLIHLVEHHGQVVAKTALMETVWTDTAVTENSLAQCLVEIRRALDDDSQQMIRTVARRGYLFAAPVTTPILEFPGQAPPEVTEPRLVLTPSEYAPRRRRWAWAAMVLALLGAGWFGWRTFRTGPNAAHRTEPLRAIPLNALPGVARYPSFSPDGSYIAFSWNGPKRENTDIYVQLIGSSGSRIQLTHGPRSHYNPVWSPDGQWIAFLRRQSEADKSELLLIPPLGGPERKLCEISISNGTHIHPSYLAWCPDSKCLVVADSAGEGKPVALFVVSVESAEKRPLTHPQPGTWGDTNPAISPDGGWLVFRRQDRRIYAGELYRLPLGRSPAPQGLTALDQPRRITAAALDAENPTWMPGGKEILFSAKAGLWRLVVPGENLPARLPFIGEDGLMPVVTQQPGGPLRLVYVHSLKDDNIWRIQTSAPGAMASSPPALAISSTRGEWCPQFSPDGRRVAFISDRSGVRGTGEIWLADPDGSNALPLTSMSTHTFAPRWSPEGQRIIFHSNWEVHVIAASGGAPRKLSSRPASEGYPSFSRDGRWIYFSSNRTGDHQIWKMPVSGGDGVQVTSNGGMAALQSTDGSYIYYVQTVEGPSPLWRLPVSGGVPVKVLEGAVMVSFAVLDGGIYYIDRPSGDGSVYYSDRPSGETRLQYFDFATRRSTIVARNLGNVEPFLTATPDGGTILYTRIDSSVDNLMLVENFR